MLALADVRLLPIEPGVPAMYQRLASLLLATLTLSMTARAEPNEPPASADRKAQAREASIDRGFIAAHAETIGKGKWAINSYEILGLGVTYGVTDELAVSLTTIIPVAGAPFVAALAPKYVLYRADRLLLSARVLGWWGTSFDDSDGDGHDDSYAGASGGVLADYYFDEAGRYAVHAGLSAGVTTGLLDTGGADVEGGALVTLDVGVSLGVTDFMKIIVEGEFYGTTSGNDFQVAPVSVVNYGLRFHSKHFAADVGMVRPFGPAVGKDVWVPGYPFVAFSVRP